MTPRNALLYPEPQQGEVTPADAWGNARDSWLAGTDARTYGVQPVPEGATGRDVLAQYINPSTGEMTPAGQQYSVFPGGFVGSSGGPKTIADALAARYHPITLSAEQLGIPGLLERVSTRIPTVKSAAALGPPTSNE